MFTPSALPKHLSIPPQLKIPVNNPGSISLRLICLIRLHFRFSANHCVSELDNHFCMTLNGTACTQCIACIVQLVFRIWNIFAESPPPPESLYPHTPALPLKWFAVVGYIFIKQCCPVYVQSPDLYSAVMYGIIVLIFDKSSWRHEHDCGVA